MMMMHTNKTGMTSNNPVRDICGAQNRMLWPKGVLNKSVLKNATTREGKKNQTKSR